MVLKFFVNTIAKPQVKRLTVKCRMADGGMHPGMNLVKMFHGGKIKIFMIIKDLHVQIGHFVAQTLGADQKKIFMSKSTWTLSFSVLCCVGGC